MKFGYLILSFFAVSSAYAANAARDAGQIKAVADAVLDNSRAAEGESIRAIINYSENSGGRIFIVQYVDEKGTCTQEAVDVFTKIIGGDQAKTTVTFSRQPRQKCR